MADVNVFQKLAAVTALKKQVDAVQKELKQDAQAGMAAGDSRNAVFDLDGQSLPLGKVTLSAPKYGWGVSDEAALVSWARYNMPSLVRTVVTFDGSFTEDDFQGAAEHVVAVDYALNSDAVAELLRTVTAQNGAFDPETGEEIPGVAWLASSSPSLRIHPDKNVQGAIALIRSEGRLNDLLAIEI